MTINERIRYLRKEVLKLNQTDFAKAIGMKQTGLSYIEKDNSTIKEQVAKSICMVFNLNEDWLLNGNEPMFVESDTFSLDEYVKQHGGNDLELQIIKTYFDLDSNMRGKIIEHFRNALTSSAPAATSKEKTVAELEDEYKKSRLDSAQKTGLSASNGTGDIEKATNQ